MCELEVRLQKYLLWNFPTWKFMGCLRYIIQKIKTRKERNRTWKSKDMKGNPSNHSCLHIYGPCSPLFSKNSNELGFKRRFLCCLGLEVSSCDVWIGSSTSESFFGGISQLESLWCVWGIYFQKVKTWKERNRTWKSKDTKGNPSNHSCLHIYGPFSPTFFFEQNQMS